MRAVTNDADALEGCSYIRLITSGSFCSCSSRGILNKVAQWAFCGSKSLREILLPQSVVELEKYAMSWMPNLELVKLQDCCIIGDNVFWLVQTLER